MASHFEAARLSRRRHVVVFLALVLIAPTALSQVPVTLPAVSTTAQRTPPGPSTLTGVVRDTGGATVDGVEISISRLQRRKASADDGTFRFDSMPQGKFSIRARKFGYAPQIREFEVGREGGLADFELLPLARALPAIVSSAVAGGLSGLVGDTSFVGIANAEVSLTAKSLHTRTDSTGAFYLPAPAGGHIVTIRKSGFKDKVVSVSIPKDSGRHMTAFLTPFTGKLPVRESWNVRDMESRIAWRNSLKDVFYTREDMSKLGAEWAHELVQRGGQAPYDKECSAIVDGGPTTARLNTLTVDQLESMEVYGSARAGSMPYATPLRAPSSRQPARASKSLRPIGVANSDFNAARARFENQGMFCTLVYVWLR